MLVKAFLNFLCIIFIFIIYHLIHFRIFNPSYPFITLLKIEFLISAIYFIGFYFLNKKTFKDSILVSLAALGFFLFFSTTYTILVAVMADRSVSVFMLMIAKDHNQEGVSKEELYERLNAKFIIDKRIEEHAHVNAIEIKNDKIYITPKGKLIVWLFETVTHLLRIKTKF